MNKIWLNKLNKPVIYTENNNKLDIDNYLIPNLLHMVLFTLQLNKDKFQYVPNNKNDGVYLVSLRVVNRKNKVIVYNYIQYSSQYILSLVAYFILRNYFIRSLSYSEFGYYTVILDNRFLNECNIDKYVKPLNIKEGVNTIDMSDELYEEVNKIRKNKYDILNFVTKLMYICDCEKMGTIVNLGFNNEYSKYTKTILSVDSVTNEKDFSDCKFSILNTNLFVVKQIDTLVKSIEDKGFTITQGPQRWRGQINGSSSFLTSLDMDYRDSLYNHYNHHKPTLCTNYVLSRKHFTFENIHINSGNVRWFSSTRKLNNRQKLFENSYTQITNIIESNKDMNKKDIQIKIEKFLYSQEELYFNEAELKKVLKFTSDNYTFIASKTKELKNLMSNWNTIKKTSKVNSDEYALWINKITEELGVEKLSELLIELFMYLLTNETINIKDQCTPGIPTTEVYNKFGKRLLNRYIFSKYLKEGNKISLSQYKIEHNDELKEIYEDNFYARVGGNFVWSLNTVGIIYEELDFKSTNTKEQQLYIRVYQNVRKQFINDSYKKFHLPIKLPMICKPKPFVYSNKDHSKNVLGGYLLNDIQYTDTIFKDKIGYGKPTKLEDKNLIVDLVNGLACTPYKINKETLNFIYMYGIEKNIVLDPTKPEFIKYLENPYKNYNKRDSRKYRALLSKIMMEKNILSIAEIYSNIDQIYFPIRLDFRTRIYCETDYFDYQKSDLAKGLISFSNPGCLYKHDLECIKLFKAFGANMFGEGLDKKSLNYRAKWIDDNTTKILNFENNDMINKAENKVCFISFCFEYKKFVEFMNNKNSIKFYTYLPIQLDASCNGYQHLSLLTKETKLFDKLNLDRSTYDDKPDDFYAYVLIKTEEHVKTKIQYLENLETLKPKDNELLNSLKTLTKMDLDRSIVKKAIMTKSYNSTIPRQVEQILENTDLQLEGNSKFYSYKNGIKFRRFDVITLVMVIKEVINNESPRIKELSKYLDSIVSICTKLNIPIPWVLPSGAVINSSYYPWEETKIKAFSFVKSRYTFRKFHRDTYNLKKQKSALMPNLIHSLDGSSIALLYEEFKDVGSIYTVHDCFAVTADNVPKLMSMLKLVYMKLYSNDGYLRQFDYLVKLTINKTLGDKVFGMNDNYIYLTNNKKIPYPDIKKILNYNLDNKIDRLTESSYILI